MTDPNAPIDGTDPSYPTERSLDDVLQGGWQFDIGALLQEAWDLFMRNPGHYLGAAAIYLLAILFTGGLAAFFIFTLMGGMYIYVLKELKGEPVEFNDMLAGFKMFGPTFFLSLVYVVLVGLGMALCLAPGFYLMTVFVFAAPLLFDRGLDSMDAIQTSVKVANANIGTAIVFLIVVLALHAIGNLVPFGTVVTQPLTIIMTMLAYRDLFGLRDGPVDIG